MKKKNSYADLLTEERQIQSEIDQLQNRLETEIKEALNPATLFDYWSDKAKDYLQNKQDDRSIQDYLIDISLDYLVYQITKKLLSDDTEKKFDIKQIIRTTIEQYYIKNNATIKALVSDFISVQLERLKEK